MESCAQTGLLAPCRYFFNGLIDCTIPLLHQQSTILTDSGTDVGGDVKRSNHSAHDSNLIVTRLSEKKS